LLRGDGGIILRRYNSLVYYPVFLKIKGKKFVVIGGGKVALRKVKTLLECGADIKVISPHLDPELAELILTEGIDYISREYEPEDTKDVFMTIAATDVTETNLKIAEEARNQRTLVNISDSPEQSDFIVPSFFRRGDLILAVSTSGRSPALARKIRSKLEKNFGEEYGLLLSLIKEVRSELKQRGRVVSANAWQEALDLDLLIGLLRAGQKEEVKAILLKKLEACEEKK
jgi:siroheme synthase-like protein